jgi:protein gp37
MTRTFEWQPISGCGYYSPGCTNCKTMRFAPQEARDRFVADGLVVMVGDDPIWSGEVRFDQARLEAIRQQSAGVLAYVCPHGDLFHEKIPDTWIDRVFELAEARDDMAFQFLTKRVDRQRHYVNRRYAGALAPSHFMFGASVERQREADERLPQLIATLGTRYVLVYPMLERITLRPFLRDRAIKFVLASDEPERIANEEWIRALATDCQEFRVPFSFGGALVGAQ